MTRSGRAAIEIIGDVSKFAATLRKDLDRAVKGVKVDTRPIGQQITDGIGEAVDKVGDVDVSTAVTGDKQAIAALRAVSAAVDEVGDEARETEREMRGATSSVTAGASTMSRALGNVGVAVTSIGAALVGLGASAPTPAGIVAIGAALIALGAAIPVVIALGAALADLVGLLPVLPAAAGVAAAAFAALKIATNGVADAFEAVLDGDPEKIAEALKKLAPAARSVVGEFQELLPALRGLQRAVQQSFFEPLEGALTGLAARALPTLRSGLSDIAGEIGELGAELLRLAGGSQALGFLRGVFTQTRAVIDRVTDSVDSILNIVFRLGNAGLPLIQRFVDWVLDGVDALSAFLSSAEGQTALNDFLADAVATLKDLWALGRALGGLVGAIFGGADDEGRNFLQTLTDITNRMAEFFRSPAGQDFLQNLLDLLPLVVVGLKVLAGTLMAVGFAVNNTVGLWTELIQLYTAFQQAVIDVATAIGGWFVNAWNTASAAVGSFFTGLGGFFDALPGRIGGWLAAAALALLAGLRAGLDAAVRAVGAGIVLIVFAVTQLPGLIGGALQRLAPLLASLFTAALSAARAAAGAGFSAIVALAAALVIRATAALSSLGGRLRAIFTAALSAARSAVVSGFNAIVSFAGSVPGRLSGLAGRFLAAGRGIIAGFFRGLSSGSGFAGNVGAAIVSSVRGGLNRVIGSINAGIGAIDAALPGSLPRIPGLATGGLTTDDLLARLHPNELVLPLESRRAVNLLSAAMRRAADTGTTPSPGSLQAGDVEVHVYVGDREITDIVDVRIAERDRGLKRRVLAGAGAR